MRSGGVNAYNGELNVGVGLLVGLRCLVGRFFVSSLFEASWVHHFGIFGPTGMAGEVPGFLHYVFRTVGTTVVPPDLPGSTLRSVVRLARCRYLFARSPVTQTGTAASAGRAPSSSPTVFALPRPPPLPGTVGGFPLATMGHLKDLRAYVEYASRTIICSGVGGRIPADDNGALRDVAVVSVLGRLIYQRSAQRQWLCAWSTKWHWPQGVHHRANGPSVKAETKRV